MRTCVARAMDVCVCASYSVSSPSIDLFCLGVVLAHVLAYPFFLLLLLFFMLTFRSFCLLWFS